MRDNGAMMRQIQRMLLAPRRFFLLCLAGACLVARPALADTSSFTFAPTGRPAIKVWIARPAETHTRTPILFALHGMGRNAESMRNAWTGYAESQGVIVVAPEFDKQSFPKETDYNLGNIQDARGKARPQTEWTFRYIEELFTQVKSRTGSQVRSSPSRQCQSVQMARLSTEVWATSKS
jgi:poly(3-hydroxybutyrate) depolymerase